jgi:hypothetical protein
VPQLSGATGLTTRWLDSFYQYEGYAYLGLGVLLLLACNLRGLIELGQRRAQRHAILLVVFAGFLLFAISNRIDFGLFSFEIPAPYRLLYEFGIFRASGRFFWPVGYALAALAVFLTLHRHRPATAMALLGLTAAVQLIDIAPLRAAMRASLLHPVAPPLDRADLAARMASADAVMVFPTYLCGGGGEPVELNGIAVILAAANADLPINSVYNVRLKPDCAAEAVQQRQSLRPGTLYVYPRGFMPAPEQLVGAAPEPCQAERGATYCFISRKN